MNSLKDFILQKNISNSLIIDSYEKLMSNAIEKPENISELNVLDEMNLHEKNLDEKKFNKNEELKDTGLKKKDEILDSDSDEDIWNDSSIINEFDDSMKNVNEKVNCILNQNSSKKLEKNLNESKKKNNKWKVGDCCQAIYSEDGLIYEAEIISILDKESCIIRYFGYLNEEKKDLDCLQPSKGKKAIKEQEKLCLEESLETLSYEQKINEEESDIVEKKIKNSLKNISLHDFKMPIIPPTPSFLPNKPTNSENELLTTMLLSWYMSGYHTGYYTAMKESNKSNQNKS